MHCASGPIVSGRPLSSGSAYRYYYYWFVREQVLRRPGFWEIILGLIGADAVTKWSDRRRLRARALREMSLPKVRVFWI